LINYENTIETNKQHEISTEAIEKMILQAIFNVKKEHLKKNSGSRFSYCIYSNFTLLNQVFFICQTQAK